MSDSEKEEFYFKVSVSTVVGSKRETLIGPYTEEDLDEFDEPSNQHIEDAVWEMIDTGVEKVSKEQAENQGLNWW